MLFDVSKPSKSSAFLHRLAALGVKAAAPEGAHADHPVQAEAHSLPGVLQQGVHVGVPERAVAASREL